MATAPTRERPGLDLVRSVTVWKPGEAPRESALDQLATADGIGWIDLDGGRCLERVAEVSDLLRPVCPGLTHEMVEDVVTPYVEPAGRSYGDGGIRLASSFGVEARRDNPRGERGTAKGAGELVFEPVELLAGERWLITCWQPGRAFRGAIKTADKGQPGSPRDVLDAVVQDWLGGKGSSAGDLGVMIMYELALTYAPAHREIYAWLEDWELSLYTEAGYDPELLPQLWGSMAVLRDWISPLNRIGLDTDLDKAWLPALDREAVLRLDNRIDRALSSLRDLGDTMRSSFQLLHYQQTEEDRERSDRLQGRVAILATAFLIPTLIVGFYGANTWVPGVGEHWGFWVMVAAIVILSGLGTAMVLRWQRQQSAEARRAASQRAQLRAQLARDERAGS